MNNLEQVKRFIFTGPPGSGKTSVIKELENRGHTVIHEAATDIIADAQLNGVQAPWEYPHFIEAITFCQNQRQTESKGDLQFYDRSPFCTYALAQYLKYELSSSLVAEIDRCLESSIYQNNVFFFENLGFIEHSDARKISYEEALNFEKIHLDVYQHFGFKIITVPKGTIEDRCEFILKIIEV